MMPKLMWSAEQAGTVTKKAAEETGLKEGTFVNAGTCDAAAEAVSVGVTKPGKTMLMLVVELAYQRSDRLGVDSYPLNKIINKRNIMTCL